VRKDVGTRCWHARASSLSLAGPSADDLPAWHGWRASGTCCHSSTSRACRSAGITRGKALATAISWPYKSALNRPAVWRRVDHQPSVPGPPLNGPTTREVIQPP